MYHFDMLCNAIYLSSVFTRIQEKMHKNKMLGKEHQNNSYQNTNRNDNLLVLIFYFLFANSIKQKN